MSEQPKPDPYPLNPIFNPNDFNQTQNTTIDVAFLDANYLKFPSAQGTETFGDINVNSLATFNSTSQFNGISNFANQVNVGTQGIDCSGNISIYDYTGSQQQTELLKLVNIANVSKIAFVFNPQSAGYNPINKGDDTLFGFGQNNGAFANFCLIPFSQTACGLRITKETLLLGAGGTSPSVGASINPTHNIYFDGINSLMKITSPNLQVDGNMTMVGSTGATRQITGSYFNVRDITANLTGTQIYQSTNTCYFDNNYSTSGLFTFALNDSGGTQSIPLQISSTSIATGKNIIMGAGTTITFPDNTTQTTAYTGASNGATYTINYYDTGTTQTITMPTGCRRCDVLLVGRGGDAGIYSGGIYGGSGSGGNSTWGQGLPMYEGEQFLLSFSSTNTTGYTSLVRVANPNVDMARAYNGNAGAIGGGAGTSNTANVGTGNTSFGIWTFGYGNVGGNGTSAPPDMTGTGQPLTRGTPFGVKTWAITKYGCAQRAPVGSPSAGANQLSGYCSITYYIGS